MCYPNVSAQAESPLQFKQCHRQGGNTGSSSRRKQVFYFNSMHTLHIMYINALSIACEYLGLLIQTTQAESPLQFNQSHHQGGNKYFTFEVGRGSE